MQEEVEIPHILQCVTERASRKGECKTQGSCPAKRSATSVVAGLVKRQRMPHRRDAAVIYISGVYSRVRKTCVEFVVRTEVEGGFR